MPITSIRGDMHALLERMVYLPTYRLRRLHRLSGCLRTDPSVMAGGWAVSGTGGFSRGWRPARAGEATDLACSGTPVQISPLKPDAGEEGMEGGAAGGLGDCGSASGFGMRSRRRFPSGMVAASSPGSRQLLGGVNDAVLVAGRTYLSHCCVAWPPLQRAGRASV